MNDEVTNRVQAGWTNRRQTSGVLYDEILNVKVNCTYCGSKEGQTKGGWAMYYVMDLREEQMSEDNT